MLCAVMPVLKVTVPTVPVKIASFDGNATLLQLKQHTTPFAQTVPDVFQVPDPPAVTPLGVHVSVCWANPGRAIVRIAASIRAES